MNGVRVLDPLDVDEAEKLNDLAARIVVLEEAQNIEAEKRRFSEVDPRLFTTTIPSRMLPSHLLETSRAFNREVGLSSVEYAPNKFMPFRLIKRTGSPPGEDVVQIVSRETDGRLKVRSDIYTTRTIHYLDFQVGLFIDAILFDSTAKRLSTQNVALFSDGTIAMTNRHWLDSSEKSNVQSG